MTGEELNHASVYEVDDQVCYRASAIGSCIRALVAARMGMTPMEPPDSFKARFADGHLHEGAVMTALGTDLWVRGHQETLTIPVDPGVIITGHMDGQGTGRLDAWEAAGVPLPDIEPNQLDGSLEALIEVKSFAVSTWDKWLAHGFNEFTKYADQVSLYMHATGLPALFAVKNKNTGAMHYTWVATPPSDVEALKDKVRKVEAYVAKGATPDCNQRDYPCPFWYFCTDREMLPDQTVADAAVDALAVTLHKKRSERKAVEAAEKEARERLKDVMGTRDSVTTDAWKVGLTSGSRTKTDTERLFAEHPELDRAEYEVKTSYEQVRVTERKGKDTHDRHPKEDPHRDAA